MARPSKVKYKINLQDMFGEIVPDDPEFKADVAFAVIERIIERTQRGISKTGSRFPQYSKEYAERKGVSRGDVDLTLTEDMLSAIDVIEETARTITLGFPDETENAKAFNHIKGDTVPKRDFFGLPQKDLNEIAGEFRSELRRLKSEGRPADERARADEEAQLIRDILSGLLDAEFGI